MSQQLVSNLHMDIIILEGSGTKTRPPKCCLGVCNFSERCCQRNLCCPVVTHFFWIISNVRRFFCTSCNCPLLSRWGYCVVGTG